MIFSCLYSSMSECLTIPPLNIHLFYHYSLSACYVLNTLLCSENTMLNMTQLLTKKSLGLRSGGTENKESYNYVREVT